MYDCIQSTMWTQTLYELTSEQSVKVAHRHIGEGGGGGGGGGGGALLGRNRLQSIVVFNSARQQWLHKNHNVCFRMCQLSRCGNTAKTKHSSNTYSQKVTSEATSDC